MRKQTVALLLSGTIAKVLIIRINTSAMTAIIEFRSILYTKNMRNLCGIPAAILINSFAKLFHAPIPVVYNPVGSPFGADADIQTVNHCTSAIGNLLYSIFYAPAYTEVATYSFKNISYTYTKIRKNIDINKYLTDN